jgi:hypothetical protein
LKKIVLGYLLGDFFTNSSGQPDPGALVEQGFKTGIIDGLDWRQISARS